MSPPSGAQASLSAQHTARRELLLWAGSLYAAWTCAWLAHESAARHWPDLMTEYATWWWLGAKLVIWCVPVWLLIARRGRAPLEWLELDHLRRFLSGIVATLVYLLVIVLVDAIVPGRWPSPAQAGASSVVELFVILLVSPIIEEVIFRGYALGVLREAGVSFWRANAEAALLFTLLHLPGWFFQGRGALECVTQGANIALLGFVFGAVRVNGSSLWSSAFIHVVNNLWVGGWLVTAARTLHGGA